MEGRSYKGWIIACIKIYKLNLNCFEITFKESIATPKPFNILFCCCFFAFLNSAFSTLVRFHATSHSFFILHQVAWAPCARLFHSTYFENLDLWSHAGKEWAAKTSLYFIKSTSLACKAGVFCSANDIETIFVAYVALAPSWKLKLTNVPLVNKAPALQTTTVNFSNPQK